MTTEPFSITEPNMDGHRCNCRMILAEHAARTGTRIAIRTTPLAAETFRRLAAGRPVQLSSPLLTGETMRFADLAHAVIRLAGVGLLLVTDRHRPAGELADLGGWRGLGLPRLLIHAPERPARPPAWTADHPAYV